MSLADLGFMQPRSIRYGTFACVAGLLAAPGCGSDDDPFGGGVPGTISQSVTEGGPNPTAIVVPLTNNGTCALNFARTIQTVDGAAWLAATPISGSIVPGGTSSLTVTLDVVAPALPPGTYTGTIVLTGTCNTTARPAAGSPLTIAVNMTVTPNLAGIATTDESVTQDTVPLADTWSSMSAVGAPVGRLYHAAVWTGTEMIVWGGTPESSTSPVNTGGRYEPINATWTATSTIGAPSSRHSAAVVWTGSKVVVWGGFDGTSPLGTGGMYTPSTNAWAATATTSAPSARYGAAAVWAGGSIGRMLVWGGGLPAINTGGRFDPVVNAWSSMAIAGAPSARFAPTAVWTGTRMLVWGGSDSMGNPLGDGAAYNPTTDTWTPITTVNAPTARENHAAIWTGAHMIVWGGLNAAGDALSDGALYDPVRDLWIAMNPISAPGVRGQHSAIWTGTAMVAFGGHVGAATSALDTGGRYDPDFDAWVSTSTTGAPRRYRHTAVWTGTQMLVWGGFAPTPGTPGAVYQ